MVREQGGMPVAPGSDSIDILVLGEAELPISVSHSQLDQAFLQAADAGELEVLSETDFWRSLGRLESAPSEQRYTAAMLADLLELPIAVIRRWHRRGLLRPVEVIHSLPYFDFAQVSAARQLAGLLSDGISPATLERTLHKLAKYLPAARSSLDQLSVIVQQGEVLLRDAPGLLGADGQWRFDFERSGEADRFEDGGGVVSLETPGAEGIESSGAGSSGSEARRYRERAWELEDQNELAAAVQWYRAALAAEGPQADLCFQLAEVLYRMDDVGAARERYFMAVELAPDFVEARANLGCVLAESGEWELAAAAFAGALETHPEYADAHFHLAGAYQQLGQPADAEDHWRQFLQLVPQGPWADEARRQLAAERLAAEGGESGVTS